MHLALRMAFAWCVVYLLALIHFCWAVVWGSIAAGVGALVAVAASMLASATEAGDGAADSAGAWWTTAWAVLLLCGAAVLAGAQGAGQVIVDLTTSDPAHSRALAQDLSDRGLRLVDAAMTGGAAGADAGTLTLMLGGAEADIDRVRPVLQAIASRLFHLGPVGAGHAMKLVHNLILHSAFLATCEGLHLAERAGLDLDRAVEVLNAGNARSFVTEVRFPRDILSGTMNARSVVANLEKDLGLAQDMAAGLSARIPFGAMTRAVLVKALALGHGGTDFSHLFPLYEDIIDHMETST